MIQFEGELFKVVQQSGIFPDSKTFVDAIPRISEAIILQKFKVESNNPEFSLQEFVEKYFIMPEFAAQDLAAVDTSSMRAYISSLWDFLTRKPNELRENDSLIPLKYSYIVPGGRFREIYYWDSYFTSVGLATVGRFDLVESMVKNFVYLLDRFELIPNGNRLYYITRSQPPMLTYMVDLLYQEYGLEHIKSYLDYLELEYKFWMEHRAIKMPNGAVLNRYFDNTIRPRPEAFVEDLGLADGLSEDEAQKLYQNIRSAAESGWDFSSRWLKDPMDLKTIQTSDIVPVDLNGLLFGVENLLAKYFAELHAAEKAEYYLSQARQRELTINKYFWNDDQGFYFDYNLKSQSYSDIYALSGVVPMFVNLASNHQAAKMAKILRDKFLQIGGLATTLIDSGQQWDAPNGWAPLQWFAVKGLLNYDERDLALEIARRWLDTLSKSFTKTHVLMEKYNVYNPDAVACGGEYSVQQGFGWTNGIALKFMELRGQTST